MAIRDLLPEDEAKLRQIHASRGIDHLFPDLESPLAINKIVSVHDGKLIAAGLHLVCYETVAIVNPDATPQEKWTALKEINNDLATRAYRQGLDVTHAAVARSIGFDKRLRQLGWEPDRKGWRLWSRKTSEVSS